MKQKPKQYSNKQKKTKKTSPVKVQLSQEDLVELLTVLKNFVSEEFLQTSKVDNSRMDRIHKSLFNLEADQKASGLTISTLKNQLSCGAKTGHSFSIERNLPYNVAFRCTECGLSCEKTKHSLNKKEKKLLKLITGGRK